MEISRSLRNVPDSSATARRSSQSADDRRQFRRSTTFPAHHNDQRQPQATVTRNPDARSAAIFIKIQYSLITGVAIVAIAIDSSASWSCRVVCVVPRRTPSSMGACYLLLRFPDAFEYECGVRHGAPAAAVARMGAEVVRSHTTLIFRYTNRAPRNTARSSHRVTLAGIASLLVAPRHKASLPVAARHFLSHLLHLV